MTNPFALLADPSAALAVHERMPAGERHVHLHDDPETREEIRAEIQRQRVREAHRRARIKAALEANARQAREAHGVPAHVPVSAPWRTSIAGRGGNRPHKGRKV